MSHPYMNDMLLCGCIVSLICIFLQGLDGRYVPKHMFSAVCSIRVWILAIGFTLSYGSMFSKVWTIYRLTTHRKKDIQPYQDREMYFVIFLFFFLDFVILSLWQIIDPLKRELESFAHEKPTDVERDIVILPQLEHCSCRHLNIWLGIVFGYKGILLLFGLLLAYETRSVKCKYVNDSRFVGMSIYNVVILSIITAPVTLIIRSHQDASFAFVAVAILLSSFLAMGMIFVPKILEYRNDPLDGHEHSSLTNSSICQEEEERHRRLVIENEELKKQIAYKEDSIKELNKQLQAKMQQRSHVINSGSTDFQKNPDKNSNLATLNHNTMVGTLVNIVHNNLRPCLEDKLQEDKGTIPSDGYIPGSKIENMADDYS